jgi:hypothetical protein
VIRDDLRHQGQAQPGPVVAPRDEGFEDVLLDLGRQARPVIDDLHLKRQGRAGSVLAPQPERQVVEGAQTDRAAGAAAGLGGVAQQVQEDLQHLVGIHMGRRQGRVVFLDDPHMGGEAQDRGLARTVQQIVDVDHPPGRRTQVAELLDLFQQRDDPSGFRDDQIGQFAVLGRQVHRQKLRRPRDPGQRVLDLVREHLGHADGRAGRGLDHLRPAQPVGDLARLHQQQHEAGHAGHRRDLHVALHRRPVAAADVDIVDEKRRVVAAHPAEGLVQRRVDREAVEDRRPAQRPGRGVQEILGRRVDLGDHVAGIEQEGRDGKRGPEGIVHRVHAASAVWPARARGSRRSTSAGAGAVRTRLRRSGGVAARSMYQPRCLRTTRAPSSAP